jgi:tryptophan synthase beta chain
VAEVLRRPLEELEEAFHRFFPSPEFQTKLALLQEQYIGRPTPLLFAERATQELGGARLYIKLEGLANTGAHKINNALGQALLAKMMGKTRIIAETGAGQHGVATAAASARLDLPCTVYMGEVDVRRQRPNVFLMELFGATVVPVTSGTKTLKDAVNEALRDWSASWETTHYLLGSALGPAPFPDIVREFQAVIGREVKHQLNGTPLEAIIACVGGGSNAIGIFSAFLDDPVRLIGVEAGGLGPNIGQNAVRMTQAGRLGIVQGYKSLFILDEDGQVERTHSVSAGLDYAGIGPELAYLGKTGRVEFQSASDQEALDALKFFARTEGIVFALESAHAGAYAMKLAPTLPPTSTILVNMSGRGDKDIFITAKALQPNKWREFLLSEAASIHPTENSHG